MHALLFISLTLFPMSICHGSKSRCRHACLACMTGSPAGSVGVMVVGGIFALFGRDADETTFWHVGVVIVSCVRVSAIRFNRVADRPLPRECALLCPCILFSWVRIIVVLPVCCGGGKCRHGSVSNCSLHVVRLVVDIVLALHVILIFNLLAAFLQATECEESNYGYTCHTSYYNPGDRSS